jgi:Co/Zn/Cd efflux system component
MHTHDPARWQHDHVFNQDQLRAGEKRTLTIALITALMMVVEIAAGLVYGSMALLADGLHMASHAAALGILLRMLLHDASQPTNGFHLEPENLIVWQDSRAQYYSWVSH